MAHRARTASPARAASTDCAGVCDRTRQHDRGEEAADVKADGGPLAAAVYRQGRRWAARRTAAGCPSDDQRYAGGSRRNSDVGNDTARRDPLEHAHAGEGHWRSSDECASHLAGFRAAASQKTFKLSPDPLLIDKVRVVGSIRRSTPRCVDEKPQIQALDRTAPLLPLRPGQAERRTHDYKRHGTTSLAALEVKTTCCSRRRHARSTRPLDRPRCPGPADLDVHVIMDLRDAQGTADGSRHPRFHPHFTPTYASWLNLVDFAALECRGVHDSVRSLESAIRE